MADDIKLKMKLYLSFFFSPCLAAETPNEKMVRKITTT